MNRLNNILIYFNDSNRLGGGSADRWKEAVTLRQQEHLENNLITSTGRTRGGRWMFLPGSAGSRSVDCHCHRSIDGHGICSQEAWCPPGHSYPSLQSYFIVYQAPVCTGGGVLFLFRCRTLHFPLLNITRFLTAKFFSPLSSFCMASWASATPSSLLSSVNFPKIHSSPVF